MGGSWDSIGRRQKLWANQLEMKGSGGTTVRWHDIDHQRWRLIGIGLPRLSCFQFRTNV